VPPKVIGPMNISARTRLKNIDNFVSLISHSFVWRTTPLLADS
jgi:hypothetical protein